MSANSHLGDQIAVQIIYYVVVLVLSHDKDLIDDELLLGLLTKVHLLDSHLHAGGRLDGRVNRAGCSKIVKKNTR